MRLPSTQKEADGEVLKAYGRAAQAGRAPDPNSPLGAAARKAYQRQGNAVAKALFSEIDQTQQQEQERQLELGQQAAITAPHAPVPSDAGAMERTLRSLSGQGVIDGSGGASTIETDFGAEFRRRFAAQERARAVADDPAFDQALSKAKASAAKRGAPTAAEFAKAFAAVKAERDPAPATPPRPVVKLLASTTAKAAQASGPSVVPDRNGTGGR